MTRFIHSTFVGVVLLSVTSTFAADGSAGSFGSASMTAIVFQPSIALRLTVSSGLLPIRHGESKPKRLIYDPQTVGREMTSAVIFHNGAGVLPSAR